MDNHKMLFTVGQFAKLHNINKRTLHYYDTIGLFSPMYKGENGYRYYTYLQSAALELLLALRELNMSIEEITQYMAHRSSGSFRNMIQTKKAEVDNTIRRLKEIRRLLAEKENQITRCEMIDLDEIKLVECPAEYLLLSRRMTGTCDADYLAVLMEHMQDLGDHRQFNKSYGSMLSVEKIMAGNFDLDDCFFTRVEKSNTKSGLFIKPKGKYLRAFCKGDWSKLPFTYQRIIAFAEKFGLHLKGYSYEEGINEMSIGSMDEYITQILILCE